MSTQPASTGPAVEAIVVAFDSAAMLGTCLAALRRNGVAALVVDNASRDGSAAFAEREGARVVRSAANEGYGRGNNAGARASAAEWLLLVNPDIVLEEGAVAELLAAAGRYPDVGLLAPRILEGDGRLFFQPRSLVPAFLPNPKGRFLPPSGDCCAPFLSGACLLVRRELFLRLGGFDERIFLFYEDDDLCRRVADAGYGLVHVHGAVARHGRGRSSAPAPGRIFTARWHLAWSRAYLSDKYGRPNDVRRTLLLNGAKALGALLTGRRALIERYGGSAAGALAYLLGRTALARQGLAPATPPRPSKAAPIPRQTE